MMGVRLVLAIVAALTPGAANAADGAVVCERLASDIGLKRVWLSGPDGQVEEWRIDNARLKDYLTGSTVATSVGVEPDDDGTATGDDYRRFAKMCERTRKGAECNIVGPARLNVGSKRGVAKVIAREGERAIVGIRGTTIYCRRA